jgi:hypothetical protein
MGPGEELIHYTKQEDLMNTQERIEKLSELEEEDLAAVEAEVIKAECKLLRDELENAGFYRLDSKKQKIVLDAIYSMARELAQRTNQGGA